MGAGYFKRLFMFPGDRIKEEEVWKIQALPNCSLAKGDVIEICKILKNLEIRTSQVTRSAING